MLSKISLIELNFKSKLSFLILFAFGLSATIYSLVEGEEELFAISGVLALLGLIGYSLSRKHYLVITSDGGAKIFVKTSGMKSAEILDFINKVELGILQNTRK